MKFIKSLENEDEASLENLESIFEEIVGFSKKLYANPLGDSWRLEDLDWSLISEEGANWLDRPFTKEEVCKAIFQLDKENALGLDGFSIAMFQECWDMIKEDLLKVFMEFHNSGVINQSTNATFIALMLKKS